MAPIRRERDWPVPDAVHRIKTIILRENAHEINLVAVSLNRGLGEVSLSDRDAAVCLLKFLKFWCNLPPTVFFTATNILDRFLTKMKVQRRYLSCLVISCLNISAKLQKLNIHPKNLVNASHSSFSVKDVERMSDIVYKKLDLGVKKQLINVLNYLEQFLNLLEAVAVQFRIKSLFHLMLKKQALITHLEVIMCSFECASLKPAIVALALIQITCERFLSNEIPHLQLICLMAPAEYTMCHTKVMEKLRDYDNHIKLGNNIKTKRHFSRAMYYTRPYWAYYNTLPTILE